MGQYEVKGVDNHGVRKDGSISIVHCGVKMVPLRESVSQSHMCSRSDFPNNIKVLKKKGPSSFPLREFMRVFEIGQISVVGEDRDGVRSSLQVLLPFYKSEDDGEELSIIDVIVAFH